MCGLAGYNCSKKIIEEFLVPKDEGMKDVLAEAWLHNMHRGMDAAGFFGFTLDESLELFKQPGMAVDVLNDITDNDKFVMNPMYVFAAHTRAGTGSDPKDNDNNHPVAWGGVVATHNGMLKNHVALRNRFLNNKERLRFPEVDSAVIPLLLSELADGPMDTEGIVEALEELSGAFSFHAVWEQYPGISLFVRGTDRPLIFAQLGSQILAYGSEEESVWAVINAVGVNPNVHFDWWQLDTNHYIVVDAGEIVKWGSFKQSYNMRDTKKQITKRWLPREKGRERTLVYQTDSDYDFANKAAFTSLKGQEDKGELAYTRLGGFTNTADKFPAASEHTLAAICAEADKAYVSGEFVYAFYGNVEIIYNKSRVVKDVFNHDLFKKGQRFEQIKKRTLQAVRTPGSALELKKFIRLRTTQVKDPPTQDQEYMYQLLWEKALRDAEEDKKKNTKPLCSEVEQARAKGLSDSKSPKTPMEIIGTNYDKEEDSDEGQKHEIITPPEVLGWNNFWQHAVVHQTEPLFFLGNRICPTHKQNFTEHNKYMECKVLLNAASYAMAACSTIELYQVADPSIRVNYAKSPNYCQAGGTDAKCNWAPAEFAKVTNGYVSWLVRTSERCLTCDTWKELKTEPIWFEMLKISDRLIIANADKRVSNAN